jgi:hypothetical protein
MNWTRIGSRKDNDLLSTIHNVTHIPEAVLATGLQVDLSRYSIAERMSWAATRESTRVEDEAYSLLGIFDINMPMLYGEGTKAFIRLQRKITKTSTDHSFLTHNESGLFATRPFHFLGCGGIEACPSYEPMESFSLMNRALLITLPQVKPIIPNKWAGLW